MKRKVPSLLRDGGVAVLGILAVAANIAAQQSLSFTDPASVGAPSTNMLPAAPKGWKENMLDRQLRGGLNKSLDFDFGSLNGVAVRPATSSQASESAAAKRRREKLEEQQLLMLMDAEDPSSDPALDLMKLEGLDDEVPVSGSPLERIYMKQLQRERAGATNRANARMGSENLDNGSIYGAENRNAKQNATSMNGSSESGRSTTSGTTVLPNLFKRPVSSPAQIRLQEARANQYRQLLGSRSSASSLSRSSLGDSSFSRSASSLSRTPETGPASAPVAGWQPRTTASSVSPSPQPSPSSSQQKKTQPPGYTPPTRRF